MSIIVTQETIYKEPEEKVLKIEEKKEEKPVEDKDKNKKKVLGKEVKAEEKKEEEEKVVVESDKAVTALTNSQQLLMCFKKGDSEILVWNNETKELCELQEKDKSDEHEDIITCCDSM